MQLDKCCSVFRGNQLELCLYLNFEFATRLHYDKKTKAHGNFLHLVAIITGSLSCEAHEIP
jgi:hypothetical protein